MADSARTVADGPQKSNNPRLPSMAARFPPNLSQGNQIATIFYGAGVKPGRYPERINHFNVLRTVEDMYGLPPAGAAATVAPITDVWGS